MGRHLREGFKNTLRNGWMTFASISSVMITLIILGIALVIGLNATQVSHDVTSQLSVSAYLKTSIGTTQGQQIEQTVRQLPGVKSVQLVTKAQGLSELKSDLGNYGNIVTSLKENPLPIKLVVQAVDPKNSATVVNEMKAVAGIDQVKDDPQVVNNLFHVLGMIRNIGVFFIVALLLTTMFLISNTIKITIFSRRREIEIMKLVGATNWFIRWPFLVEGMLIGVVGALIPYVILILGYKGVFQATGGTISGVGFQLVTSNALAFKMAVVMFGIGIVVGVWGGIMSVRKFLKV